MCTHPPTRSPTHPLTHPTHSTPPTHPPTPHTRAQIKRTEGVSTTDIVGRMLVCSRDSVRRTEDKERVQLTREFSRGAGSDTGGRGWVGGWVVHV